MDLDAAFGEGSNRALIRELATATPLRVQTGGGLRSEADVAEVLEHGVARAVIGTAAVENPELVRRLLARWGAERIAVGLDARGRRPALRGWRQESDADLLALGAQLAGLGVRTLIYTDIERDGMLGGPNVETSAELARHTGVEVVVSGGVGTLAHVQAVATAAAAQPGIAGLIIGKALYEGRFTLVEAISEIADCGLRTAD